MKSSSQIPGAVSSLVRAAEDWISVGNLARAMEQLSQASKLAPNNEVVRTIMEKVRALQETEKRERAGQKLPGSDPALESSRFLSVTVGKQFERGIRGEGESPQESDESVRMRVRELTETAQILLNRGLRESAFDALMKAYLLDPLSPEVISCEKRILPLRERGHELRGGLKTVKGEPPGLRRRTEGHSFGPAKKK